MIKPHCFYSKKDLVIGKLLKDTIFDRTLLTSWRCAENDGALNYKIKECEVTSKPINVNGCIFVVTLNEKRFSKRRIPQEMTSLNQAFDCNRFNFTKVLEKEILMTIGTNIDDDESQNVIIVNASPFQEGHSLLVPALSLCHNQVMRPKPLRTALDIILVSGEPNFTVAFNSMLACASVNHLHLHLWVNDEPLTSSLLQVEPLIILDKDRKILHMPQHPINNFVIEFSDIENLENDFKLLWNIVSTFQILEIPHSIVFVRSNKHVRGIIWPRRGELDNSVKLGQSSSHSIINVAAAELAGQIYTGDKELFENHLDSDLLTRSFSRVNLSTKKWNQIIFAVKKNIFE